MTLKSVDDCGGATVELHCDEILMLVALLQNVAHPIKSDTTGSIAIYSFALEEMLRTIGIMAKLCIDDADHAKVNAMLVAEPVETVKDYNAKKGE